MPEITRILTPLDFSDASNHAFAYAVELASKLKAEIHAAHVYQLPVYTFTEGAVTAGPEVVTKIVDASTDALNKIADQYKGSGVVIHTHVLEGAPHDSILETAKKLGIDLIVMGTHGRSGLTRFLLGSVAERVVRASPIPVLTIRSEN
ncbi:MAG: universal stress protein [Myxococcales bacterium]|nr:universal stress protein [Myxococcales bacterium]